MNIILLAKQVPDVSNIPPDAWDQEKGVLRRAALDAVSNPLDLQALGFALQVKEMCSGSRIVALTMGPSQARGMLEDLMARGADEAVLLTDMKFAGADTPATAYALAQAVRRIVRERGVDGDYVIIAGAQSPDGDTAQVPPQVAEDLGMEQIAYAQKLDIGADGRWHVTCAGSEGVMVVVPRRFPCLVSVAKGFDVPARSFHRLRAAQAPEVWDAPSVGALPERIGSKGSRTWVSRIAQAGETHAAPCALYDDVERLVDAMALAYEKGPARASAAADAYRLNGRRSSYQGDVWVYAQVQQGVLSGVVREMLSKAKELATGLQVNVGAVLAGEDVAGLAPELLAAGADKVYVAEHPLLRELLPVLHKKAIAQIVAAHRPQVMLFGATPWGRALAPRVAYALGVGLTADCTALEIADQGAQVAVLKQIRPALGGNIMATIISKDSFCQMATVRPGVFKACPAAEVVGGVVVRAQVALDEADVALEIVGKSADALSSPFDQAQVVVAGGRGMGSRGAFTHELEALASALSAWLKVKVVVGASRMAVEDGFIDHAHQVGQTGTSVAPRLYVAVGVSGAVQHLVGIAHAGCVVAINKDPQAPIFARADHGIVGPFEDVMPRLVEAVRRRCV